MGIITQGTTITGIPTMDAVSYYYLITIRAKLVRSMYCNSRSTEQKLLGVQ